VGEVLHLYQCVAHGQPMREYNEVFAVENKGLKDCIHGRAGSSRQVLVMDGETLEQFGIEPGRVRENITTRGIVLENLSLAQRLRVGEVLLQITQPCTPCHQMDEIRPGLQEEIRGRRGVLCRVIEPGRIRRGDRVELEEKSGAAHSRSSDSISNAF
jgi:MOSC domain-containing protein YiiM